MLSKQYTTQISLLAGTFLLAGTAAWAQVGAMPSGGQNSSQQQQQQEPMPGQPGAAGNGNLSNMGSAVGSDEEIDKAFMRETLQNNQAQVQMSQLAQEKASSDDVKQFGQQMVQIHTQLTDQLTPVAKQLGVEQPAGPSKKDKQEIAKLGNLSGPQFDSEYIQIMAKQQQHSLKAFQQEAKTSQDPNIQEAAKMDTPVLSQHYQVLQKLAQTHNVQIASR